MVYILYETITMNNWLIIWFLINTSCISLFSLLTTPSLWNELKKTNEYSLFGKININHSLTKVWNTGNRTQSTKLANPDWWTSSFNRDSNPSITPFEDNRVNYEHNVKSLSLFRDGRHNGSTLPSVQKHVVVQQYHDMLWTMQ